MSVDMSSVAYQKFLSEYSATGRAKLDGYTHAWLLQLSEDEKEQAIALLSEEAKSFYGAIEPLALLAPNTAVKVLKDIELTKAPDILRQSHPVYFWLWKLTGDESYAIKFVECRPYLEDYDIPSFYSMGGQALASEAIDSWMQGAIFTEADPVGLFAAAKALLDDRGIRFDEPATKERHRALRKVLTSGSPEQKREVLAQLPPRAASNGQQG
ncbi:hypothetical protein OOT46_02505 [Aquabacterium sp. A7-Y]|uniref:hypothetical protein n=1 Tax=Aquabacterium sp. A7-Y TaxID=1349605 RepID=UPI00223DAC04|nr:hypothetical protein [Aquabacterium sp. A7-Y]MCW7536725.1 hypothetical protein [Aquabacterium sp. A7-Y]